MPQLPTPTPPRHATMNDRLTAEIERIRSDPSIPALDEANVKQGVILPVLNTLGWNPFNTNEVRPEYPVQGGNVDYSLRIHGANKVFLEAKRPSEDLSRHQVQLLNYSFADGVRLAVLTNGLNWWFYLPLQAGSWEERRFGVIDLRNPDVSQTADLFKDFLSRENVRSGLAVAYAEDYLDRLWKDKKIEEALPRAWTQLIADPHDQLLALLNQQVMELCGLGADQDQIRRFLANLSKSTASPSNPPLPASLTHPTKARPQNQPTDKSIGRKLVRFTFGGHTYPGRSWAGMLVTLAEIICQQHRAEFHRVIESSNHYFGRTPEGMAAPKAIGNSGYYVGTGYNANTIERRCRYLLAKFGYREQDLTIETT